MFKHLMSFILVLCASVAMAADADLVIPAAGTGPGAFGSRWATEVTLHNAGNDTITVALAFHSASGLSGQHSVTLAAKETKSLDDIVATALGQTGSITGAITIDADDVAIGKLAVTSRTYNSSALGEFGQDIPALEVSEALVSGDTGVIPGPSNAVDNRLNFGVYAVDQSSIEWRLLRRDGSVAATISQSYAAGTQVQYNFAISDYPLFKATSGNNDVVHAVITSGRAFVYGSIVNRQPGDPTYVPASRTRENLRPLFVGVDVDENGTVDIADGNGDGVLDQAVLVSAGRFPGYFRVVARDPENKPVTLTLVNRPGDALLIDADTVQLFPGADKAGSTDVLILRASDGLDSSEFRIPLQYQ